MSLQSRLMALIVTLLCVMVLVVSFVLTLTSQNLVSRQTEQDGMTLAQLLSRSAGVMDKVPEDVEAMLNEQMILSSLFVGAMLESDTTENNSLEERLKTLTALESDTTETTTENNSLEERLKTLTALESDTTENNSLEERLKTLTASSNIAFINATDLKGSVNFSTQDSLKGTYFGNVDEKYSKYFLAVLENKIKSYVSPPIEDEKLRQIKYVAVSRQDQPGIVQLGYNVKAVEDIRKRLGFQRLAEVLAQNEQVKSVWIVDKDLNTLATSETNTEFKSASLSEKDLDYVERVLSNGESVSFFSSDVLTVMAPIFGKDLTIAGATLIRLKTDAFSESLHRQIQYSVLIVILSIILGIFASYYLSKSITHPVNQIIRAASDLESGKFDPDILDDVAVSEDELGRLSRVFQNMGREVGQRAERLDALVKVRTKDIEQKTKDVERALDQLKTTQTQLVAKEKLASLGQLTAGIAHELKNPLNFVINFASINQELAKEVEELLNKPALEEKDRAYIQELLQDLSGNSQLINTHGHHAGKIIASMIQHSHSGGSEKQEVMFLDFIEKNIRLIEPVIQAKHRDFSFQFLFEEHTGADIPMLLIPQEVKRVLAYVLDNAFDAIYEKAQELLGKKHEESVSSYIPAITTRLWHDKKGGYIAICDNGAGISLENRDKIFNPFFTTKPTRQGNTGMGLSLSYDIIAQQHNGNITVESTPGEGSTFTIFIPLTGAPTA